MPHDLVIRRANVYDGTGAPPVLADVALDGQRIAAVGDDLDGSVVIEGHGLALAPGFIDVHTHDDAAVLADPELRCKTLQGVTTDIVGNCGMGIAPHRRALPLFGSWTPGLESRPPWDG